MVPLNPAAGSLWRHRQTLNPLGPTNVRLKALNINSKSLITLITFQDAPQNRDLIRNSPIKTINEAPSPNRPGQSGQHGRRGGCQTMTILTTINFQPRNREIIGAANPQPANQPPLVNPNRPVYRTHPAAQIGVLDMQVGTNRRTGLSSRNSRPRLSLRCLLIACFIGCLALPASAQYQTATQVPTWSPDDLRFFLHGSMSTEVVPENVLTAFRATYPELFPGKDLTVFGLLPDPETDLPVGVSRREVDHLGGLRSIGINCASCHVAEIYPASDGGRPVRVLGVTSHFNPEVFFGSVIGATFMTLDPANMQRFLLNYCLACDPSAKHDTVEVSIKDQAAAISSAVAAELAEMRKAPGDRLFDLNGKLLTLKADAVAKPADLTASTRELLHLFHNMRAALHVPQQPPDKAPPLSGPGRNNAFGLLSVALFGEPTIYGPAKFGVAWNLQGREWVHWDGNTRSPLVRNLSASLGLGAPLIGKRGKLDLAAVARHTTLNEQVRSPKYPWAIDKDLAQRGEPLFVEHCSTCHLHSREEEAQRLFALDDVGTDPSRAKIFTTHQADNYNKFFSELEIPGYQPEAQPPTRSTQKYVACDLAGVWARSPYLHNGSVRTMAELLTPAAQRTAKFKRGSRIFDEKGMGYEDGGTFQFDTTADGNHNTGHEYGTKLPDAEKRHLIEYLKTL